MIKPFDLQFKATVQIENQNNGARKMVEPRLANVGSCSERHAAMRAAKRIPRALRSLEMENYLTKY